MTGSDRQFIEHLEHASSIVSRWPEWKRNVLGGDSGTSNGDKQMTSLLKWSWCYYENQWTANSQILNQHGCPLEWEITICEDGLFVVSEYANRGILTAGVPGPLPSFQTLTEAKEWCEKRESELRTEKAKEKSNEEFTDWELSRQSREEAADEEMFAEQQEIPDDIDYDRAESSLRAFGVMTSTARAASEEKDANKHE